MPIMCELFLVNGIGFANITRGGMQGMIRDTVNSFRVGRGVCLLIGGGY